MSQHEIAWDPLFKYNRLRFLSPPETLSSICSDFFPFSLRFSLLLSLISRNLELRLPIHLCQRVTQVRIFPFLPFFFSILNGWNVLYQFLSFLSFCSLFLLFCLSFLRFHMLLYTFGIICTLSKHVNAQNAFMYKNMYTHKRVFVCTHEYTYML